MLSNRLSFSAFDTGSSKAPIPPPNVLTRCPSPLGPAFEFVPMAKSRASSPSLDASTASGFKTISQLMPDSKPVLGNSPDIITDVHRSLEVPPVPQNSPDISGYVRVACPSTATVNKTPQSQHGDSALIPALSTGREPFNASKLQPSIRFANYLICVNSIYAVRLCRSISGVANRSSACLRYLVSAVGRDYCRSSSPPHYPRSRFFPH